MGMFKRKEILEAVLEEDIIEESIEDIVVSRKRELEIVKDGSSPFYKFKFKEPGGELPAKLKGQYTSYSVAETWRDLYYSGSLNKA